MPWGRPALGPALGIPGRTYNTLADNYAEGLHIYDALRVLQQVVQAAGAAGGGGTLPTAPHALLVYCARVAGKVPVQHACRQSSNLTPVLRSTCADCPRQTLLLHPNTHAGRTGVRCSTHR